MTREELVKEMQLALEHSKGQQYVMMSRENVKMAMHALNYTPTAEPAREVKPKKDFLNGWREAIQQLPVSREPAEPALADRIADELTAQASWVPSGPAAVMRRAAAHIRQGVALSDDEWSELFEAALWHSFPMFQRKAAVILSRASSSRTEGWLRACDEALVCAHLGIANADDTFEVAQDKLRQLIEWEIAIATDPKVNGGYVLTKEDSRAEVERLRVYDQRIVDLGVLVMGHAKDVKDANRYRFLCSHPDWKFIEDICRSFVAESASDFYEGLSLAIDSLAAAEAPKECPNYPCCPCESKSECPHAKKL